MKATFENSVNVLLKAYLNDTLQHSNCHACAVGNLVAYACGLSFINNSEGKKIWTSQSPVWQRVFMTSGDQDRFPECYIGEPKEQIDSTGYTWQDLAAIEFAFETAPEGESEDDHMFNSLMAVVDVLADIHKVDLSVREEAKALFIC